MLTCEETEPELGAYLDGELTPRERATIDAHLVLCEKCNAVLNQIEFARKSLTALPKFSAPPALAPRIHAALRNEFAQALPSQIPLPVTLPPQPVRFVAAPRAISGHWPWAAFASGAAAIAMVALMGYVALAPSSDKLARVSERPEQLNRNEPINAPAAPLDAPIQRKAARAEPDFSAARSRPADPALRNLPTQLKPSAQAAKSAYSSGDLRANQNAALARDKAEPPVAQEPAPALKNAEAVEKQMALNDAAKLDALQSNKDRIADFTLGVKPEQANRDDARKLDLVEKRGDSGGGNGGNGALAPKPAAVASDKILPPVDAEKRVAEPLRGAASAKKEAALAEQLQRNETESRVRAVLGAPGKAPAPNAAAASTSPVAPSAPVIAGIPVAPGAPPTTAGAALAATTPVAKAPLIVIVRTPDVPKAVAHLRELAAKLNASVEYAMVADKDAPYPAKTPTLGFGGKRHAEYILTAAPQQRSALLNELYSLQAEGLKYSFASKPATEYNKGAADEAEDLSSVKNKNQPAAATSKTGGPIVTGGKDAEQLTIKVEFYAE